MAVDEIISSVDLTRSIVGQRVTYLTRRGTPLTVQVERLSVVSAWDHDHPGFDAILSGAKVRKDGSIGYQQGTARMALSRLPEPDIVEQCHEADAALEREIARHTRITGTLRRIQASREDDHDRDGT